MATNVKATDTRLNIFFISHGTLKEEHVDYSDYDDFDDAQHQLGHWLMDNYNTQLIHSALDYHTLDEFAALALTKRPYGKGVC